jgi:RNA polymerase-binding transcription factor DksA
MSPAPDPAPMSADHEALAMTLAARRAELSHEVRAIAAELQAPLAADFAEQATETEESQTLEALEVAHRNEIDAIDTVLARLAVLDEIAAALAARRAA